MAQDTFDLVKQFSQLRDSMSTAPTSVQSYAPPTAPSWQGAQQGGLKPPPAPAPTAAPTAQRSAGGQGLIPYGGKQIAAGLKAYAAALTEQGMRFTSGYRDPVHNKEVGGVPNSLHMKQGDSGALDFVGTAKQMQQGAVWAKANGAKEVLVHNVGSGQHLHIGW